MKYKTKLLITYDHQVLADVSFISILAAMGFTFLVLLQRKIVLNNFLISDPNYITIELYVNCRRL